MILTAVYLHKRKAEEVKAGLGVSAGVLFPPVCVCVMSVIVECWYWLSAANERVSYWSLTWSSAGSVQTQANLSSHRR